MFLRGVGFTKNDETRMLHLDEVNVEDINTGIAKIDEQLEILSNAMY